MNTKLLLGISLSIIFHFLLLITISSLSTSNTYSKTTGKSRIRAVIKNIKSIPTIGKKSKSITNNEKNHIEEVSKSILDKQGQDNLLSQYLDSIRNVVASTKYKNSFATRLNLKGQVDLSFKISSPNLLSDLKITKNSKASSLNESALAGIKSINSFPSIPSELYTDTVEVEVSIIYE
jgi:outer membrane biosynthesis protein TonB